MKATRPTKAIDVLHRRSGFEYTHSSKTDIRKTYARVRREYAQAWDAAHIEKAERERGVSNVRKMGGR